MHWSAHKSVTIACSCVLCDTQGNRVSNCVYICMCAYGSFIVTSIQLTTIFCATKGRRGEYEVSRDCQKAGYDEEDTTGSSVYRYVYVDYRGAHTETRRQKRTRQSRIPIAPSRYGASCGAAAIKAPVTHCSCPGQWACTGDSAWFRTRLLSSTRKRFAICRSRRAAFRR